MESDCTRESDFRTYTVLVDDTSAPDTLTPGRHRLLEMAQTFQVLKVVDANIHVGRARDFFWGGCVLDVGCKSFETDGTRTKASRANSATSREIAQKYNCSIRLRLHLQ